MTKEQTKEVETGTIYPSLWCVKIFNDDLTPMNFVVNVLNTLYNKPLDEAEIIARKIHEEGSAVIGIYTKEIAITKVNRTYILSSENGHPLKAKALSTE